MVSLRPKHRAMGDIMRPLGIILIVAAILLPLVWFYPLAMERDGGAIFSQYLGSAALIAMGISMLLSMRFAGLEFVFGSLDRMYVLHKWLGLGSMAAILLHDTIDAELGGRETVLTEIAETFGEISLYGLLILMVITIATFIPYHLWRWTHRLMGLFFAMSVFHYVFIMRPFSLSDPVGLYVLAFCIIGLIAYAYSLLPYGMFQGRHRYEVVSHQRHGEIIEINLKPLDKGMAHKPGQFAFLKVEEGGLSEVHPFTIASAPEASRGLRFAIKELGDYTFRLALDVKPGSEVRIAGPYGHFTPRFNKPQIWIAGGVGITPFLAWAEAITRLEHPVHLFYCVPYRAKAAFLSLLEKIAAEHDNFYFHLVASNEVGRLSAEKIVSVTGPVNDFSAAFCGPEAMRVALRQGLASHGLNPRCFRYEEFEIRSGIGLRKFGKWLWQTFGGRVTASLQKRSA